VRGKDTGDNILQPSLENTMTNQSRQYVKQVRVSLWLKLMIIKLRDQIDWPKTPKCSNEKVRNGYIFRKLADLGYAERRGRPQNRFWTLSTAGSDYLELTKESDVQILKEMTNMLCDVRGQSMDILPDSKLESQAEGLLRKIVEICAFCETGAFVVKRAAGDALRIALTKKGRRAFYIERNIAVGEVSILRKTGWELTWIWRFPLADSSTRYWWEKMSSLPADADAVG
jgi:hypothetical protein